MEVTWPYGALKNIEKVEFATAKCMGWLNDQRLLEPIGNISPVMRE
jgi:hypothetical protein